MVAFTRSLDRVFPTRKRTSCDSLALPLFDPGVPLFLMTVHNEVVFKILRLCRVTLGQQPDVGAAFVGPSFLRVPRSHVTFEFKPHFIFLLLFPVLYIFHLLFRRFFLCSELFEALGPTNQKWG